MEGPIAVGGNYTVGTFNIDFRATTAGYSAATVGTVSSIGAYVQGNIDSTGATQITDSAYVGSASGNTLQFINGGTLHSSASNVGGVTNFFNQTAYINQSNFLASLTGQAINTSDQNNLSVDLNTVTGNGNLKVLTIPAAQLLANRTLSFTNFNSADTILINVTGGNITGFGLQVNGGNYDKILWNDNLAGSININSRTFEGSLLAPNAAVSLSNVFEGNLIAASLTDPGGNELHFGSGKQFDGTLISAPEPGSVGLLIGGIVSTPLLLLRRRRK